MATLLSGMQLVAGRGVDRLDVGDGKWGQRRSRQSWLGNQHMSGLKNVLRTFKVQHALAIALQSSTP